MTMAWSPEQREWLRAMGYELLAPAAPGAEPPAAAVAAPQPMTEAAPRGRAPQGGKPADPLLQALLRAARSDAADEVRAVAAEVLRHRADPAAKRAAWPRLRALRAGRR